MGEWMVRKDETIKCRIEDEALSAVKRPKERNSDKLNM